jgi:hypothetical protein
MNTVNNVGQTSGQDVSLEELVQEIDIHESMLQDLDGQSSEIAVEQRRMIHDVLEALRADLRKFEPQFDFQSFECADEDDSLAAPGPQTPPFDEPFDTADTKYGDDGDTSYTPRPNSSSSSQRNSRFTDYSNQKSPFLALPSRFVSKRRAEETGNEPYGRSGRENKSRRTTPSPAVTAPTTPSSTTDSFEFDLADDPLLQQLLAEGVKGQMRESRKYERELERKREQEKADEKLARMIQEEYKPPQVSFSKPTNLYQTTFDLASGAIKRPMPPPPRPTVKPEPIKSESIKAENEYKDYLPFAGSSLSMPGTFSARDVPSPASFSDSDSDLVEISPSEFIPGTSANRLGKGDLFGAMDPGYPAVPTFGTTMPGAYPGAYTGVGGSSVYNLTAYSPYPSTLVGGNLDVLFAGQDSLAYPFDPPNHFSSLRDYRDSPYSDPAKTEEEIKELLAHIRPDEDIDASSREGTPPEMKLILMEHQKLGLAWMKKMEEGSNKGGKSLASNGATQFMKYIARSMRARDHSSMPFCIKPYVQSKLGQPPPTDTF